MTKRTMIIMIIMLIIIDVTHTSTFGGPCLSRFNVRREQCMRHLFSLSLSLPLSLPPFFLSQLASIIFVLSLSAHAVELLYLPRLVYTNDSHRVDLLVCLSVLSPYIDKNHFKSTSFVPLCCDSAHRVSHYD